MEDLVISIDWSNPKIKEELHIKEEVATEYDPSVDIEHEIVHVKIEEDDYNRFEDAISLKLEGTDKSDLMINKSVDEELTEASKNDCNVDEYIAEKLPPQEQSKVTIYQCEKCEYSTKYKSHLKRHFLIHQDSSEVPIYQCEHCEFKTKYKAHLKKHFVVHKDPSEVTMYKCEKCEYKTKRKTDLKNHFLVHRDSLEVTTYQCGKCIYKTRRKGDLRRHLSKHKDSPEVTVYRCEKCEYKTKYERLLEYHSLNHHGVRKGTGTI